MRRVLIVANRTAATPTLLERVKQLARERPSTFTLLIPDAPKSARTDWTIEHAVPLLERVEGLGLPVTAIESTDAQPPDPGAWAALSG